MPVYISVVFIITTFLTVYVFYKAVSNSKITLIILLVLLMLQGIIGLSGFYTKTDTFPPRIVLLLSPSLLLITWLFSTVKGKNYIDTLNIKTLTILHVIRIPIECVLFWLYIYKSVPQLMTFEGRNYDILSGITAPFIYYFGLVKKQIPKKVILLWNFICLGLLINIVVNAILSVPVSFQQFAFDQPNVAVLYFPFVWLPACVVPLVLLSHLATIRHLLKEG